MKEIFDRHARSLETAERAAVWRAIQQSRPEKSRAMVRWGLSTAAAVVAAGVITFVVVHREPTAPPHTSPAQPSESSLGVLRTSPEEHPGAQDVQHDRAIRRGSNSGMMNTRVHTLPQKLAKAALAEDSSASKAPSLATSGSTGAVTGVVTDSNNSPVPFANVIVVGRKQGTMSGEDGAYRIDQLPPATYSLQVVAIGYGKQVQEVQVVEGEDARADVRLGGSASVKQLEEVEVRAEKRIDTKSSATKQSISAETLRELPVDNVRGAVKDKTGVVARGGDLHFRGGRGGEVQFQIDGSQVPPGGLVSPPVVPTTGGTKLPNDEAYDSMFFKNYGVNPFITTDEDSLSTFAVDVDAASYTLTRRYLELGHLPPADAVRVEEFVNFFPQGYPKFDNDDFRILVDGAPSPFGHGYHLVRIGLKGREIREQDRKPAQLAFVIDVSGSMQREDRLELVKRALRLLVDQLREDDRVGIVVFGTDARVLLEPTALGESVTLASANARHSDDPVADERRDRRTGRERILEAIDLLQAEGSTNTEQGLLLGYEMARRGYRPKAINRIVLCSDGVANEGRTGAESILDRVKAEADRGIYLSTIGFGMGNYNDVLMEQLADKGDGNYYYVDDLDEARRVFVQNLTGTLQTIARDAKVQVEFHSSRVLRYRLLGFENRDVADRDFRNDKVDAGEIGAGHEVTALYEVKLAPQAGSGPIATVRLRYARPEHDGSGAPKVREIATTFTSAGLKRSFEAASPHFRMDAAVAEFAEILRGSYWARGSHLSDVLSVARSAARGLREDAATEFVSLVEKAAKLSKPVEPTERKEEP